MRSFEYRGHTLTWKEHSQGEHTYILLPSWSSVQSMWGGTVNLLRPRGRVITIDLPGHYPAHVPGQYNAISTEELFQLEAGAIRDICGPGGSATLIGHSTGGMIALALGAMLPDMVRRVVSVSGVVWGPLHGVLGLAQYALRHQLYPAFWGVWRFTQLHPLTIMFGLTFYVRRPLALWRSPLAWQIGREAYPCYSRQQLENLAVLLQTLEHADIRPLISAIRAPILMITGSQDPIVPARQAQWVAARLPEQVTLHSLEQVGHVPFMEAPERYRAVLNSWLDLHPVTESIAVS
jgi:pimeloyl-ACP methyl ester carboxylesterase